MHLRTQALLAAPLLILACGQASDDGVDATGQLTLPPSWDRAVTRPASEDDAAAARAACRFRAGAMPAETLGRELPVDRDIPIQTIVVLMQENRSFDSYFSRLNQYAQRTDIASAADDASSPENVADPSSPRHARKHGDRLCFPDTNHEWSGSQLAYNGGRMDGFFQANQGFDEGILRIEPRYLSGERALWWYDERDIKFYYDLASTFAIGDHYHASLLGPTYPNRDYLYAATSLGVTDNSYPDLRAFPYPAKDFVIFDELSRRGISWTIYTAGFPRIARIGTVFGVGYFNRWAGDHVDGMGSFYAAARAGKLPQVAFIDAPIQDSGYRGVVTEDEHPPGDIQLGQKFVSDVTQALFKSPQWRSLALFLTYDEGGGIFDHVPPPSACPPDAVAPILRGEDAHWPGAFDRLGFRVPFIVVSPFTKKAFVSHKTYDHTSITRFIEAKFKLPAMTSRDANADPLYDFFDFERPPFLTPPTIAKAVVDVAARNDCVARFGTNPNPGGDR